MGHIERDEVNGWGRQDSRSQRITQIEENDLSPFRHGISPHLCCLTTSKFPSHQRPAFQKMDSDHYDPAGDLS
jgi:hypothetical protein